MCGKLKMRTTNKTQSKRRTSSGKPKRPLSAYNFFFRHERNTYVTSALRDSVTPSQLQDALKVGKDRPHRKLHGKIDFASLTKRVSEKWRSITPSEKAIFEEEARIDLERYRDELAIWKETRKLDDDETSIVDGRSKKRPLSQISSDEISGKRPRIISEDRECSLEEFGNLDFFPVFKDSREEFALFLSEQSVSKKKALMPNLTENMSLLAQLNVENSVWTPCAITMVPNDLFLL